MTRKPKLALIVLSAAVAWIFAYLATESYPPRLPDGPPAREELHFPDHRPGLTLQSDGSGGLSLEHHATGILAAHNAALPDQADPMEWSAHLTRYVLDRGRDCVFEQTPTLTLDVATPALIIGHAINAAGPALTNLFTDPDAVDSACSSPCTDYSSYVDGTHPSVGCAVFSCLDAGRQLYVISCAYESLPLLPPGAPPFGLDWLAID